MHNVSSTALYIKISGQIVANLGNLHSKDVLPLHKHTQLTTGLVTIPRSGADRITDLQYTNGTNISLSIFTQFNNDN